MDEYAGRVLAERYRLPARPAADGPDAASDGFDVTFDVSCPDPSPATRAFDTYSGQEVLIRQVPLPEVVDAEVVAGGDGGADGFAADGRAQDGFASGAPAGRPGRWAAPGADRDPRDPVVRRALQAATAAAQLPDHPLLDQVFDVFTQDGSLWIVGELLPARPLAALLAGRPLSPHRAAEIAADLLTALRALHAHGWLHRNVTARTVLVCDDGRAVLTGLAAGAAQEALCGYDPVPRVPAAAVSLVKAAAGSGAGGACEEGGLTGLAAERARQARLQVVGPVTERWAPEQAGPVDGSGAPLGPAADLWAVGALLFRAVQGQPPFPEDSAVELARLVRAQAPAEAAAGGVLRPVIEALLCFDPAGRPGAEELRGRLRALVRTAPEPDLGRRLVSLPALEGPADPRRLPILRRRGELVRRGRPKRPRVRPRSAPAGPSRSAEWSAAARSPRAPRSSARSTGAGPQAGESLGRVGVGPAAQREPGRRGRAPRSLGAVLLTVILLLVVAGIAYAVVFLPKSGRDAAGGLSGADLSGSAGAAPGSSPVPSSGSDDGKGAGRPPGAGTPQTTTPGDLAPGFALRTDPAGFQIAVPKGWQRRTGPDRGQVRYAGGGYELLVVPGRDTTARFGADPLAYQQDAEPELAAFRGAGWSSAAGLRRIDVGQTAMAEGTFSWRDGGGRQVYARNLAMIDQGRYHLVLVIGPEAGRAEVDRFYAQASSAYRPEQP
ncbi:serine/threonine-protein kinase [Streptomyces noursei]|uniref:serine/threonine-protein kinase n=1 Tax=Streptomyces noursei TaxID=1971 RepID=UPI0023B84391|nr:protein kinase [Streptomyces noursei]